MMQPTDPIQIAGQPVFPFSPKKSRRSIDRMVDLASLSIAALLGWLTLTPAIAPPIDQSHMDKVYHLVAFAALILPCAVFSPRRLIWFLAAAMALGGGIELVQPHVGRSGEWLDFFADAVGLGVGVLLARIIRAYAA